MTTAGFIGLGNIGEPIARRLLANDDGLVVYDVRPDAADKLVAGGARLAESLEDVAASADVISVMVRDDAQVREVIGAMVPALRPDTVIAIHSTIHAATAIELEPVVRDAGGALLDAPVSGGAMGAASGRLALMIGGDEDALERARPVLSHFADLIVRFGPVGMGTKTKLARNLITFAAYAAVAEAQHLAVAAGLDIVKLGEVVRHSDAVTSGPGAIMHRDVVGPIDPADGWWGPITGMVALGEKDLALALELGAEVGVDVPFAAMALDRLAATYGVPHSEYHPSNASAS